MYIPITKQKSANYYYSYTMTLNGCLTRLYIIVSIFNGPVTFVSISLLSLSKLNIRDIRNLSDKTYTEPVAGLSEYSFSLFSILGVFVIRKRAKDGEEDVSRYWTRNGNPIIFCVKRRHHSSLMNIIWCLFFLLSCFELGQSYDRLVLQQFLSPIIILILTYSYI